jgi:hypothetical protein
VVVDGMRMSAEDASVNGHCIVNLFIRYFSSSCLKRSKETKKVRKGNLRAEELPNKSVLISQSQSSGTFFVPNFNR